MDWLTLLYIPGASSCPKAPYNLYGGTGSVAWSRMGRRLDGRVAPNGARAEWTDGAEAAHGTEGHAG